MRAYSMTEPTPTPLPGSFGLSQISGPVGWLVWLGQLLAGDASRWTHAWLILDDGQIIEGQPGGAKIERLADRYAHREIVFTDKPVQDAVERWKAGQAALGNVITVRELIQYEESLRARIVATGQQYENTSYGWLNYLYIGLKRLGLEAAWLRKKITDDRSQICSQLIDTVYMEVDIHLFDDGRWSGEVTPGDLDRYAAGSFVCLS